MSTKKGVFMKFFNADEIIRYQDYKERIFKLKKYYIKNMSLTQKLCIYDGHFNLKKYIRYRKKLKKIIKRTVLKCVNIFKEFLKDIKFTVLISGSYARDSFRDASDIDVAIMYENKKTNKFLIFEELFCLALSSTIGVSRDKIHNVFSYLIQQKDLKNYDGQFEIKWRNGNYITYKCRPNTEYDMFLFRIGSRKYEHLMEYIENNMVKNPTLEWLRSYDVWHDKLKCNIAKNILMLEKKIIKSDSVVRPKFNLEIPYIEDKMTSANLKKLLKYNFLEDLYSYLSYVRLIAVKHYNYNKLLNIEKMLKEKVFKIIIGKDLDCIYKIFNEYMWTLSKIENCMKELNLELSIHNFNLIDLNDILRVYRNKYVESGNPFDRLRELNLESKEIFNRRLSREL